SNPCTFNDCNSITVPPHTPYVSIIPRYGNVCTTDYCDAAGVAHHDLLPIVDDNNPCTTDGCDQVSGEYHTAVADGLPGTDDDNRWEERRVGNGGCVNMGGRV